MLDALFNPLHLLLLLFVLLIVVVTPLLLIFLSARWLDRRLQSRPGIRVSAVAVVIGGITDIVSSSLLAIPMIIYVMVKYGFLRASNGSATIASLIHSSVWLYGMQLTVGMACSALGGYVAARLAKHDELLNGLLSSFLCIIIGLCSILSGKNSHITFAQIFILLTAPAFALLGGYFRQAQKSRVILRT